MTREELTQQALDKALGWAEAAEGFVAEQAPLVVQDIIRFGYINGLSIMAISLIPLLGCAVLVWVAWRGFTNRCRDSSNGEVAAFLGTGGGLVTGITGLLLFAYGVTYLAWVHFTPRLYVIEQIGQMLK